jgi:hypothetical protein
MMDFKMEDASCIVNFTEEELLILNNSFNEICYGLNIREFELRMGTSKQEILGMLQIIHQSLNLLETKM